MSGEGLVLCGGYSRDMLLGRVPRDLDFILPTGEYPSQQAAVEALAPRFLQAVEELGGTVLREYWQYCTRIMCVVSAEVAGAPVQLILPRNRGARTPAECTEQFNWNFNHAYYHPTSQQHQWVTGVAHEVQRKVAVWKCSSEYPEVGKYREKLPDWDFSLYLSP